MALSLCIMCKFACQRAGFSKHPVDQVPPHSVRVCYHSDITKPLLKDNSCCANCRIPEFRIGCASPEDRQTAVLKLSIQRSDVRQRRQVTDEGCIGSGEIRINCFIGFAGKCAISSAKFISGFSANVKKIISCKSIECALRHVRRGIKARSTLEVQKSALRPPHERKFFRHLLCSYLLDNRAKQCLLSRCQIIH